MSENIVSILDLNSKDFLDTFLKVMASGRLYSVIYISNLIQSPVLTLHVRVCLYTSTISSDNLFILICPTKIIIPISYGTFSPSPGFEFRYFDLQADVIPIEPFLPGDTSKFYVFYKVAKCKWLKSLSVVWIISYVNLKNLIFYFLTPWQRYLT